MDLSLPQLSRLRAFVAVGRHGSFKRAAQELHVTQSALSHHVRHLEAELSVRLLNRLHRRIELTAEGAGLLAECSAGFATLAGALRRLRLAGDGPLTVSVAPYFSARWLTPRLASLWAQHPDLDLQLRHAYQPADLLRDGVDAGISWGSGQWPEVDATRVLTGELTPVCSPDLLRTLPRRPSPSDLLDCRLLCEFDGEHWRRWFDEAGVVTRRKLRPVQIDDSHALRRSVLDGHGVGLFFCGLIHEDLESGLLHAPFETCLDPGCAYYLTTPQGKAPSPKLKLFSQWLMNEVAQRPWA